MADDKKFGNDVLDAIGSVISGMGDAIEQIGIAAKRLIASAALLVGAFSSSYGNGVDGTTVLQLGDAVNFDSALVCDTTLFFSEDRSGEIKWTDFSGSSGKALLRSNAHVIAQYCLGEGRVVALIDHADFILFDRETGKIHPLGSDVVKAKRGVVYLRGGGGQQPHKKLPDGIRVIYVPSLKQRLGVDPDVEWAFDSGAPLALIPANARNDSSRLAKARQS
ncbi:MAG: hypothetical protein H7Z12_18640 [Rhodospirillaceae bacterium]|nr:hypothetical protein [Rhodospirillales bacterium]